MFCFYTFTGVTFTYVYQLTFFTAVMAYSGIRESKGLHAVTFRRALLPNEAGKSYSIGVANLKSKYLLFF